MKLIMKAHINRTCEWAALIIHLNYLGGKESMADSIKRIFICARLANASQVLQVPFCSACVLDINVQMANNQLVLTIFNGRIDRIQDAGILNGKQISTVKKGLSKFLNST